MFTTRFSERSAIGLDSKEESVVRARAPLRISFCGGGTDVPPYPERYGGCVLSCTIDKYAYVSAKHRLSSETTRVDSADLKKIVEFSAHQRGELSSGISLAEAVIRRFGATATDCYMHCDAPPGSGLGSSSAMLVALAAALARYRGIELTPDDLARVALTVERQDLGIVGGLQDQYAAAYGGFNFIEFSTDGVLVHPLRLKDDTVDELHYHLLLCYTGATRFSSHILAEQKNNVETSETPVLDALHGMKELALAMRRALLLGKCRDFGALMDEAWALKRQLASGISNSEIDTLYETARKSGALGGKILGAGGGGYLLIFTPFIRRNRVKEALEHAGGRVVDFQFESRGAQTWIANADTWIEDSK